MKLAVLGNDESFLELTNATIGIEWQRATSFEMLAGLTDANGYFNLHDNAPNYNYAMFLKPVFVNCVSQTTNGIKNVTRINGWRGFLSNSTWEIAGNCKEEVMTILSVLNKKVIITADVPGFISASVIAMIVNEAYYAKEQNVSTEEEIDVAMRLGTNYPFGPFEWAGRIGLKNIYNLLHTLSATNKKYAPAGLLVKSTL